jgi:hypothetical protein
MHTATLNPLLELPARLDPATLQAHALSASGFHEVCRVEYRWHNHMTSRLEWLDSVLARRFATTLVLVGIPALLIALLT